MNSTSWSVQQHHKGLEKNMIHNAYQGFQNFLNSVVAKTHLAVASSLWNKKGLENDKDLEEKKEHLNRNKPQSFVCVRWILSYGC